MNVLLLNASPRPDGIVSQALAAAASTGPAGRSRDSVREVLSTGGMRVRSVAIAGTKPRDGRLPEAAAR